MLLFFFSVLRTCVGMAVKKTLAALDIFFIFMVAVAAAAWLWESLPARLYYVGSPEYILYAVPCVWIMAFKDLGDFKNAFFRYCVRGAAVLAVFIFSISNLLAFNIVDMPAAWAKLLQ